MTHTLTAVISRDGAYFVAQCPELDVASQGESLDESLFNLKEAVALYLADEDPSTIPGLHGEHPVITLFDVAV